MIWIKILLALFASLSVILIFDARPIVRRFFTSADRNNATRMVKIVGTALLFLTILLFGFIILKQ